MPAPEIGPEPDSVRILNGEHGPILCLVAEGQVTMRRLSAEKLITLLETGFSSIREMIVTP